MEVPSRMALPHHLIAEGLVIAMELALLLHQVGMLSHHIDNHKALGKPRKSKAGDRELEAAAGDDASA
jgi:hypothetical protein